MIALAMRHGKTKREFLRDISGPDLMELVAYNSIEPIGPERADLRSGMIASVIVNALGGKSQPSDFLLSKQPEKPKETPAELHQRMKLMVLSIGGRIVEPGSGNGN